MTGNGHSTDVLDFRLVASSDRERLLKWRNLPEVRNFMYTNHDITEVEHQEWFGRMLRDELRRDWIILLDGKPLGLVSMTSIDRRNSRAEWAFYLADPAVRGRGIGSAVEFWALRYMFEELGLNKICCAVLSSNPGVMRLHESFGFVREGLLREHIRRDDGVFDVALFALTRAGWAAARELNSQRIRVTLPAIGVVRPTGRERKAGPSLGASEPQAE